MSELGRGWATRDTFDTMRVFFCTSPRRTSLVTLTGLALALACASGCAAFGSDPAREARLACDKRDGSSCFLAGNLVAEKSGTTPEVVRLYARGCAVRHSPSCEALGSVKGPLREQALMDACNGGDLVSCSRRASEFSNDEKGLGEARALRHSVCKKSASMKPGISAREVEGIAESCAALARMIAAGEGGGRDVIAAAKLDVLAATLRNEALYQHERIDDAKPLPRPAQAPEAPDPRAARRGIASKTRVDPTIEERAKFRREYEARKALREAWMASVDASLIAEQRKATRGDPSVPSPSALERAMGTAPTAAAVASRCQTCVDGCGSMSQCSGDDFIGGRCGQLRGTDGFEGCVAECTSKADACAKACGDCTPPKTEPTKGGK